MKLRRIEVEIQELVLHGLPRVDGKAVGDAIQAELTRLIGDQGLGRLPKTDVDVARLDAGTVRLDAGFGAGLARAAFRATIDAAQGRSAP